MSPIIEFPVRKLRSRSKTVHEEKQKQSKKNSPVKISSRKSIKNDLFDSKVSSKKSTRSVLGQANLNSPLKAALSPKKGVENAPSSPKKTPRKALFAGDSNSPLKTPKKESPKRALFNDENESPSSPRKSPRKCAEDQQPNSPRKSPRKALGHVSPTKASPRKSLFSVDEAMPSPRQKKLQLYRESSIPKSWSLAKQALQTGMHEGASFIGRSSQQQALQGFLEYNLRMRKRKGKSSAKRSLYVCGPPGTGKTSLLRKLLSGLETDCKFKTAFINCMALKTSGAVFAKIAESFGLETSDAQKAVEEMIVNSKLPVLLVLDEIDQLNSKSQQVLYTLYEWPYLKNSMLSLVGVANALDLTDRILPRLKLRESVCPGELTFPAYSREEIIKILSSRLESVGAEVFKPGAIRFLAAKISALSGDVRKALDVCRRALELSEVEVKKQALLKPGSSAPSFKPIDVPQILKIVNEVYSSSAATTSLKQSNSDLPLQQKIIVASLLLMTNYGMRPVKEVTLGKLSETYSKICKKRGMAAVNLSEVSSMCTMLEARGFFAARRFSNATKDTKLSLRIDEDEVEAALKDKALLSGIVKDVDCISK